MKNSSLSDSPSPGALRGSAGLRRTFSIIDFARFIMATRVAAAEQKNG
jgi:hypothetical protein